MLPWGQGHREGSGHRPPEHSQSDSPLQICPEQQAPRSSQDRHTATGKAQKHGSDVPPRLSPQPQPLGARPHSSCLKRSALCPGGPLCLQAVSHPSQSCSFQVRPSDRHTSPSCGQEQQRDSTFYVPHAGPTELLYGGAFKTLVGKGHIFQSHFPINFWGHPPMTSFHPHANLLLKCPH